MAILPDFIQALYYGVNDVAGILSGGETLHGHTVIVTRLVKRKGRGFHERRDKAAVLMLAVKLLSTAGGIRANSLAHHVCHAQQPRAYSLQTRQHHATGSGDRSPSSNDTHCGDTAKAGLHQRWRAATSAPVLKSR